MNMKNVVLSIVFGCFSCLGLSGVPVNTLGSDADQPATISKKELDGAAALLASLTAKEQEALKLLIIKQLQTVQAQDTALATQGLKVELEEKMRMLVANKPGFLGFQTAAIVVSVGLFICLMSLAAEHFVVAHNEAFTVVHHAQHAGERDIYERPLARR